MVHRPYFRAYDNAGYSALSLLDILCKDSGIQFNTRYVTKILMNKNPRRELRKLIFAVKDRYSSFQLASIAQLRINIKDNA